MGHCNGVGVMLCQRRSLRCRETVGKLQSGTLASRRLALSSANTRTDLDRLAALKASLTPEGALWIIRPKDVKEITEADTMAAGKAAGLVDVKVVRFSDTHTAEKFVIP